MIKQAIPIGDRWRGIVLSITILSLGGCMEAQWLEGYGYRSGITIESDLVPGIDALEGFPILFSHTDASLKSVSFGGNVWFSDGRDICFTDRDSLSVLDYEIEAYNPETGSIHAWIRIPSLSAEENTPLFIYYGNPEGAHAGDTSAVWGSQYSSVWHMGNDPASAEPQLTDATSSMNHGSARGNMKEADLEEGKIANGIHFDGIDDYAILPVNDFNLEEGSIALWIKMDSLPEIDKSYFFAHRQEFPTRDRIYMKVWPGGEWGISMGDQYDLARGDSLDTAIWYHVALSWKDNQASGYLNGSLDIGPVPFTGLDTIREIFIMTWMPSSEATKGTLDELRVSRVSRDPEWIQASYLNQHLPEAYIQVGESEDWFSYCAEVYDVSGGGEFFEGDSGVHIILSGSEPGFLYTLLLNDTIRLDTLSGNGDPLIWSPITEEGTYRIEAENAPFQCKTLMNDSAVVSVKVLNGSFAVSGGGSYCPGDKGVTITLSDSQLGVEYNLLLNDSIRTDTLTGSGELLEWTLVLTEGWYRIEARISMDTTGIVMEDSVEVIILDLPQLFVSPTSISCFGENDGQIDLTVYSDTGYTIAWNGPGGFESQKEDLSNLSPGPYIAIVRDQNNCMTQSPPVEISQPALLVATVQQVSHLSSYEKNDGTIDLHVAGGTLPYYVAWTGTDGYFSSAQDPTAMTVGYYDVMVTDSHLCRDSVQMIEISVEEESADVFIPEAFSPNGDGMNDHFVILGIERFPENELLIFNRQGVNLFHKINYSNDWDGRPEKGGVLGGELPEGSYYYIFRYGREGIKKGFVYINRK